ncbi:MAG: fibronectin type III domain-containing protein [Bacillota bacterium]
MKRGFIFLLCCLMVVTIFPALAFAQGSTDAKTPTVSAAPMETNVATNVAVKALAAPTSVKASIASITSIKISWGAVSGATGYQVWRSTSESGIYSRVVSTAATSFMDTGLTAGSSYYYKVRAYTSSGGTIVYSGFSSVVSRKLVPGTPISVKASIASITSIKISWAASSLATGYQVWRSTSESGAYTRVASTSATSFTNTGLTAGQRYYYKVRAYAGAGGVTAYSAFSSVVSANLVLGTPQSVKASRASYAGVKISWGAVSLATGYQVYRSTSESGTYARVASTASTSYVDNGVTAGNRYYYKVRAYAPAGSTTVYSAFSSAVSVLLRVPSYTASASDETVTEAYYVSISITNTGDRTMRIGYAGYLEDNDYDSYDRDLRLVNSSTHQEISYLDIPAGQQANVTFGIIDGPTWYDANSKIYYLFAYDGIGYMAYTSNYYGTDYEPL